MSTTAGLMLEDPEGSKMMWTRVDDLAIVSAMELAPGAQGFRMFEEDRVKLRAFLSGSLAG